jgi:hypothetical protein
MTQIFTRVQAARDSGVTDPDTLLKMIPAALRNVVQGRGEGRFTPSARGGQSSAFSNNVIYDFTHLIYPDVDEAQIKARNNLISKWGVEATPSSLSSNAAGTNAVMQQAARAAQAFDDMKLANTGLTFLNRWSNTAQEEMQAIPEIKTLRGAINGLSEAATRAARGNGGAERDIQRLLANIDINAGKQGFYNSIKEITDYIGSLARERQGGIDMAVSAFPKDQGKYQMISPEGQRAATHFIQRYDRLFNNGPGPPERYEAPGMGTSAPAATPSQRKPLSSF